MFSSALVGALSPDMLPGLGLDQLRADADAAAGPAHAAFEHIAYAEFAPDLLHIDSAALEGERRIADDHE